MPSSPWLLVPNPLPAPRLRLFCLPGAGAAASAYFRWPARLPADVELCAVQPPGRANRLREPPFHQLEGLVEALQEALDPFLDRPFALFGHSLGATVAYEWTRRLQDQGRPLPRALFLAARQAPPIPRLAPDIRHLPDRAFLEALVRHYDAPPILLSHPDLAQLVLPTLRADFAIVESYRHRPGAPLHADIIAIAGRHDPLFAPESVRAWEGFTTGRFEEHWLDAGHGLLESQPAALTAILSGALSPAS